MKLCKVLNEGGVNAQFIISLQSFTDEVLKNIERKNMDMDKIHYTNIFANQNHLPVGTELILGHSAKHLKRGNTQWANYMKKDFIIL